MPIDGILFWWATRTPARKPSSKKDAPIAILFSASEEISHLI